MLAGCFCWLPSSPPLFLPRVTQPPSKSCVIDGDTMLVCCIAGKRGKVRYIAINSSGDDRTAECEAPGVVSEAPAGGEGGQLVLPDISGKVAPPNYSRYLLKNQPPAIKLSVMKGPVFAMNCMRNYEGCTYAKSYSRFLSYLRGSY